MKAAAIKTKVSKIPKIIRFRFLVFGVVWSTPGVFNLVVALLIILKKRNTGKNLYYYLLKYIAVQFLAGTSPEVIPVIPYHHFL